MTDLVDQLFAAFTRYGNRPAVNGTTYSQLAQRVSAVVGGLHRAGFVPGDRMLFSIRPNPDGLAVVLGTIAAGGTIVFIDPGMGADLFRNRVQLVQPGWTATESLLYALSLPGPGRIVAWRTGLTLPAIASVDARHFYYGRRLPGVPAGAQSVSTLMDGPLRDHLPHSPDLDALIVFTSGTTGQPKGVVHTRSSLGAGMGTAATQFTDHTVLQTDQLMIGIPALLSGAHWRMPRYRLGSRISPARLARTLDGATDTFVVPADLPALLDSIEAGSAHLPQSLRRILLGGAPVPPALIRRAARALPGVDLISIYGMTEILPVAIAHADTKIEHDGPGDPVGRACAGVTARIGNDDELLLSGPALCRGYLGEPATTEHHTGDRATITSDGTIVLHGRIKDMILRGKTNIYPGLYEPTIEKITGVAHAILIGVPDRYGDDVVVLALTADNDEPVPHLVDSVRGQLRRLIDLTAQPDHIVVVKSIPTQGRSRKPDRNALRDHVREVLGL